MKTQNTRSQDLSGRSQGPSPLRSCWHFEPTPKDGKKAAVYIRSSVMELLGCPDKDKHHRQAIKNQLEDALRVCTKHGWEYEIYDEDCELHENHLGKPLDTKRRTLRPGLSRLLEDIKSGLIHTVIVRDITRLARNTIHLRDIVYGHLLPYGVVLHGINENYDFTTPEGLVFISVLSQLADLDVMHQRATCLRGATTRKRNRAIIIGAQHNRQGEVHSISKSGALTAKHQGD